MNNTTKLKELMILRTCVAAKKEYEFQLHETTISVITVPKVNY